MARTRSQTLQLIAGLALGLGGMGWFVASLQWQDLGRVLLQLDPLWLAAAVVVALLQYVVHAWRWGVLLEALDPRIPARLLWSSTAVLWGFNTVLPLRAGNLARPLLIARDRNLSFTSVLFATVAEYVCDAFGIIVMVLWLVFLLPPGSSAALDDALMVARWVAVGAIAGFVIILLLSTRGANRLVARLVAPLPSEAVRARVLGVFGQLVAGMASVRSPSQLGRALLLTLGVWGGWLVSIVCTLHAFGLDLPLAASLFLEAALTLSMMVPQAPGFLGVFQVVTEEALGLFRVPTASAQGVALVFWTVIFVPITVIGLIEGARSGVSGGPSGDPTEGA